MIAQLGSDQRRHEAEEIARVGAELVACGSLEMGAHRPGDARVIADLLPAGTSVYVNHLPRHSLESTLQSLIAVRNAGLVGVPHLAARRVVSRAEARVFLKRAVRFGEVRKVLLIGGDVESAAGPYASGADLLADGLLGECGVREVALPGYPEGHPRIPQDVLQGDLERKLSLARDQGLGVSIVTQFSFAPIRIVEYCTDLERRAPGVPVYTGLAGPTSLLRLMRFAQICGVSASLRALRSQGIGAVTSITHTDPGEQLAVIARHCLGRTSSNIVGTHVFSFGGVEAAAAWMNQRIRAQRDASVAVT